MVAQNVDNLLAVGKSSSGGIKFRTHMLAMIMGQAAGTSAAISVEDGVPVKDVPIRKGQAALRKTGVGLPEKPEKPQKEPRAASDRLIKCSEIGSVSGE